MKRSVLPILLLVVAALCLPATAWAGPAGTSAAIRSVVPGAFHTVTDDYGTFQLYDAHVVLSWSGAVRLNVYLELPDGTLSCPGEVSLSGSGNREVVVSGVVVPKGTSGVFLAQASKLSKRSWVAISTRRSLTTVSFPAS